MTKAQADKIKKLADKMVDVLVGGANKDRGFAAAAYIAARHKLHETIDNFTYPEKGTKHGD